MSTNQESFQSLLSLLRNSSSATASPMVNLLESIQELQKTAEAPSSENLRVQVFSSQSSNNPSGESFRRPVPTPSFPDPCAQQFLLQHRFSPAWEKARESVKDTPQEEEVATLIRHQKDLLLAHTLDPEFSNPKWEQELTHLLFLVSLRSKLTCYIHLARGLLQTLTTNPFFLARLISEMQEKSSWPRVLAAILKVPDEELGAEKTAFLEVLLFRVPDWADNFFDLCTQPQLGAAILLGLGQDAHLEPHLQTLAWALRWCREQGSDPFCLFSEKDESAFVSGFRQALDYFPGTDPREILSSVLSSPPLLNDYVSAFPLEQQKEIRASYWSLRSERILPSEEE